MTSISLFEKVNPTRLAEVLVCSNFPTKASNQRDKKTILQAYAKKKVDDGYREVKYKQPIPNGRFYADKGQGLQMMSGDVRKYICFDENGNSMYVDIDFVNCHPRILQRILEMKNIRVAQLDDYIINKDLFLEKNNLTKEDFLSMLNDKNNKNTLLTSIHTTIYETLLPLLKFENMSLYKYAEKKYKKDPSGNKNIQRTFIALYLQEIENKMLMSMYRYFVSNDFIVGVLCNDGIMVENDERIAGEVLREIEQRVLEDTGFEGKLAIKSMETKWRPNIPIVEPKEIITTDDPNILWAIEYVEGLDCFTDDNYGVIAHYFLQDEIKYIPTLTSKVFYYFNDDQKLWVTCKDCIVKRNIGKTLTDVIKKLVSLGAKMPAVELSGLEMNKECGNIFALSYELYLDTEFESMLDSKRNLVGCLNGVVELDTKTLRERRKDDYISRLVNARYNPELNTDTVYDIILSIMAGDISMTKYMKKKLGYVLTGETAEEVLIFWTGTGRNGKGLLTNILFYLMREFHCQLETGMIVERKGYINEEVQKYKLFMKRVCVINELKEKEVAREDNMKMLSGGDPIPCKQLYKSAGDIIPYHQVIVTTNPMPRIDPTPAFVERIIAIPFETTFRVLREGEVETPTLRKVDDTLKSRCTKPDFLNMFFTWMVEGTFEWYRDRDLKSNKPERVKEYMKEYFSDCDLVDTFINDECETDPSYRTNAVELYKAYIKHSKDIIDKKTFYSRMDDKGFVKPTKVIRLDNDGVGWGILGIRVKTDFDECVL